MAWARQDPPPKVGLWIWADRKSKSGLRVGGPASRRFPEARSPRGVLESRHPVGLHEDHVEVGPSEVGRPGKRRLGQGEGPVEDRSGDDPEG